MYCHNCGKQVSDSAKFCRYCGAPLTEEDGEKINTSNAQESGGAGETPGNGDLFGFDAKNKSGQSANNIPPQNVGYTDTNDKRSFGFGLLGFFIPLVGFILWLVWRDDMPNRARSCAKGALAGVIAYVVLVVIALVLELTFLGDFFEEYYYYFY